VSVLDTRAEDAAAKNEAKIFYFLPMGCVISLVAVFIIANLNDGFNDSADVGLSTPHCVIFLGSSNIGRRRVVRRNYYRITQRRGPGCEQ